VDFFDNRRNDNWAVFIQDEYTITDKVIFNGGVRYDRFETIGGTLNPRVALIYSPDNNTSLKAVYGSAFRAPNVYELYFEDGGVAQKGNPDLKPETIDSYEIIYEQFFKKIFHGTIVAFQYNVQSLIKQTTDSSDGLLVFDNSDEIVTRGVEIEMEGTWQNGLEGRVSYTYQKAKEKGTEDQLTNSPVHVAKANLSIPVVKEKLFFSIEEQYTSKRKTLYREKQEGLPASLRNSDYPSDHYAGSFAITNVTLLAKNLINNMELSASIYNLFGKKNSTPGAGEHFQNVIEQNGTTGRLKATYLF
jgi:iron complex outermembrane receptor protein